MKRQPTIVNQPPISLISPDNVSASDSDHTLARVLKAHHQPKPTFSLSLPATHKLSQFTYTPSPIDRDDEPRFATIHESLIDSRDKRCRDEEEDEPLFATEWSAFATHIEPHRFSTAHLANVNRQHIVADHHGCQPCDIAASETTKPFSRTKLRLLSAEQSSARCIEVTERRDNEREEKKRQREAEWLRELATWPPFIPRNPINPSVVVERDREWFKQHPPATFVLSYRVTNKTLPPPPIDLLANVRICVHRRKRSFPFTTGGAISLCPDCGMTHGHNVLQQKTKAPIEMLFEVGQTVNCKMRDGQVMEGEVIEADTPGKRYVRVKFGGAECLVLKLKPKELWEKQLEAKGLPAEPRDNPIVLTREQLRKELEAIEAAQAAEGKASAAKSDYRASQIRKDIKTNTEAPRTCVGCGEAFVPTRKGQLYHSDNCRKQHHKRIKRRGNGDSRD